MITLSLPPDPKQYLDCSSSSKHFTASDGLVHRLPTILGEALYFNDLRHIFNQLIFQPVNVFTHLKIGGSELHLFFNLSTGFKKGL